MCCSVLSCVCVMFVCSDRRWFEEESIDRRSNVEMRERISVVCGLVFSSRLVSCVASSTVSCWILPRLEFGGAINQ